MLFLPISLETCTLPYSIGNRRTQSRDKVSSLSFGASLEEEEFRGIQSKLSLDFFKWDCQVGDVFTLFRQPLLLHAEAWEELKQTAETLATELLLAEEELLVRPDLHALLGMPAQLRSALKEAARYGQAPPAVRTLRFDFHYSTDGWRISEVNSDVPGGYTEASAFTNMVADCVPDAKPAGDPTIMWADTMMSVVGERGNVALLSAVGFLEDQQVTAFLANRLHERGVEAVLLHHPAQLKWRSGRASTVARGRQIALDAIVRFYQGEWLAKSGSQCEWQWLFARGKTPVTNPGSALLTESKRFPLTWDGLSNGMNTWRSLLPESCDPGDQRWQVGDEWVLKMAFSNTGDEVHIRELMSPEAWNGICRMVQKNPERWIAQRRFQPVAIVSDLGPVYPCIGVYVIAGRAAGAYARLATRQVIDYSAMDAALLIHGGRNAE